MIRRICGLMLLHLVVFVSITWAQGVAEIRVRSGEHPTFSRLVFETKGAINWSLTRQGDVYRLQFLSPEVRLDLSQIFKKIPKRRLQDVTLDPTSSAVVLLSIANDHHPETQKLGAGKLVLDIKEGPPDNSAPEMAQAAAVPSGPGDRITLPTDLPPVSLDAPMTAVLQPPSHRPEASPNGERRRQSVAPPESTGQVSANRRHAPGLVDIRVLEAQDRLLHQLGRAMTLGVVDPVGGAEISPKRKARQPENPELSQQERPDPGPTVPPTVPFDSKTNPADFLDHLNLTAKSAFDRAGISLPVEPERTESHTNCKNGDFFEVAKWAGEDLARNSIAKLRRDLVREFDKAQEETLQKLVRLYIFHGFGAEARALIESFDVELADRDLLLEMAQIVDLGLVKQGDLIASMADCPDAEALWAILARPEIPLGEIPDREILHRAFTALPISLRERIGPVLATRLLDGGFPKVAADIASLIARAPGNGGADFVLLLAKLDLATGRVDRAFQELADLVGSNQPNAAQATLLWVRELVARDLPVPQALKNEISARALELRFSDLGLELRRAEISAHSAAPNQSVAFQVLTEELRYKALSPSDAEVIAAEIFLSFDFKTADRATFVEAFFAHRGLLSDTPNSAAARKHIATGMLSFSLPEVALETLAGLDGTTDPDVRILRARAMLLSGRALDALDQLENLNADGVSRLRFEALAALEEYEKALEIDGSDSRLKADIAWRAGRWDLVKSGEDAVRRDAARFISQDGTMADEPVESAGFAGRMRAPDDLSLSNLNRLLGQSQTSRAALGELLAEHPSPSHK